MLMVLGVVLLIVSAICSLIVLVEAFQNEVWKGLLALFCNLYWLYYMFVEFEHEKKALIVLGSILGAILGWALLVMGGGINPS